MKTSLRVLLDTTAYSELLRGNTKVGDLIQNSAEIYLPQVVVAELRYGFRLGSRELDNEKLLSRFVANKKVRLLLPDNASTDYFVDVSVFSHRKGVKLSTHDIWIAALALQWDCRLITFDKDFAHLAYPKLDLWQAN